MLDERHEDVFRKYDNAVIEFARKLVQIRSYSGEEEGVARLVAGKMEELGYDEVFIDAVGNVMGRIGDGPGSVLFDSHMDTVEVNDEEEWISPPFGADIKDGRIYGRGSVDMKSSLAASLYSAVAARDLGFQDGRTIYVTATVSEEYCDGENLKMLFTEKGLRPDFVVICEPSNNLVTLGHKGKAQVLLRTHGVSAHGSAPEKGVNAVYEMAEIITRVEKLNDNLAAGRLRRDDPALQAALARILARAEGVTEERQGGGPLPSLLNAKVDHWLHRVAGQMGAAFGYRRDGRGTVAGLLSPPKPGRWDPFTCLNSLRDVEPSVNLLLDEDEVNVTFRKPWVMPVAPAAGEEGED